jgi:hypothetical protein
MYTPAILVMSSKLGCLLLTRAVDGMGGSGQSLKVRPRQGGPALWPCPVQVLPAPPVPPPSVSPKSPKCSGRPWRVEAIRRFLTARTPCPGFPASLDLPKCTAHHPAHPCLKSFHFKVTWPAINKAASASLLLSRNDSPAIPHRGLA